MGRFLILSAVAMLLAVSAVTARQPGGWSKGSVKDQDVIDAANFAVRARQTALRKEGKEDKLALHKITAVDQQVVAGMNYKLTLEVKVGDKVETAHAKVWARVWLKPEERYQLTEWRLADEKPTPP